MSRSVSPPYILFAVYEVPRDQLLLELTGRGAIVAGTRRLGATVVERLAREGLRLAIVYRSSSREAEEQAETARRHTDRVVTLQADLAVEADVARVVDTAASELGDLSFCVNLAYDYPRTPLEDLDALAWEKGLSGAKAAYLLASYAGRAMKVNPGPTRGHLILCGDWASGETPYLDYLPYLTGKAAIHFMTRNFALELADYGILVNTIAPGPTAKPPEMSDAGWDYALQQTPLGRESSNDDIAELIATLLKLETITGETIRVDAGRHIAGTAKRNHST